MIAHLLDLNLFSFLCRRCHRLEDFSRPVIFLLRFINFKKSLVISFYRRSKFLFWRIWISVEIVYKGCDKREFKQITHNFC